LRRKYYQTARTRGKNVVRFASGTNAVDIARTRGNLAVGNKRARSACIILKVLISTARRGRLNAL